jgi:hypothetical protein
MKATQTRKIDQRALTVRLWGCGGVGAFATSLDYAMNATDATA